MEAESSQGHKGRIFDEDVRGFSLRIFISGSRHFTLDYRVKGRQRRFTIGRWPEWTVTAAREQAKALRRIIDDGGDPLGEREAGMVATRFNPDMKAKYQELIANGKCKKLAITAVMRKLIVMANALLRDGRKWTETRA